MTSAYKVYITLSIVFTAVLFFCMNLVVFADTAHTPARYIVVFENGQYQDEKTQDKLIASVGGQVALRLPFMNGVAIEVPEKAVAQMLQHKPGVAGVYEDVEMSLTKRTVVPIVPTQPAELMDWGVDIIDADVVWAGTDGYTGAEVNVAILDTGIDEDHPDLVGNVKGGIGFVPREVWSTDGNGHGTHVAGTIAALDNEIGVIGVAHHANLYGVQVLNKSGSGYLSSLLYGIDWAVEKKMDVISLSLGFPVGTTLESLVGLKDRLDAAEYAGIVVVVAAGNDGSTSEIVYPAAYPTVIAVAATNADDTLAYYSNRGSFVDVAAPGTAIRSTYKNATYTTLSGTSMATPHVTGVVALLLDKYPNMTNDAMRVLLSKSVKPINPENTYSFGRIDAVSALAN